MKYALNAAPIAGPRTQFGAGAAALALAASGDGVVAPLRTGAAAMAMSVTGQTTLGVYPGSGAVAFALDAQGNASHALAITGAGQVQIALASAYGLPSHVVARNGFGAVADRLLTVEHEPRGFTVQPDSVEPVAVTTSFAVPNQGGR